MHRTHSDGIFLNKIHFEAEIGQNANPEIKVLRYICIKTILILQTKIAAQKWREKPSSQVTLMENFDP